MSWFRKRALPGLWYGSYHAAWNAAHPGAWKRGELETGSWRLTPNGRDIWCSSTLDWDREWFRSQGFRPPRLQKHVEPDRNPNIVRIGDLGPGESVSIPIVFTHREGRRRE